MTSTSRPETNLVQVPIKDLLEAPAMFGYKIEGCTPLVYTPEFKGYRIHRIVVFVAAAETHTKRRQITCAAGNKQTARV